MKLNAIEDTLNIGSELECIIFAILIPQPDPNQDNI